MNLQRITIYIFICLSFLHLGFSQIYISEISFTEPEYIEVFTTEPIEFNVSDIEFRDNNLRTFTLNKTQESSNYHLFISKNFRERYTDFSNLNCTIYENSNMNLGLLNSGESFNLTLGENLTLNYTQTQNLDWPEDKNNYSLHFFNNTDEILLKTPCAPQPPREEPSQEDETQNPDDNTNQNQPPQDTNTTKVNCSNFSFEITTKKTFFHSTIEWKFKTNLTGNSTLEYWVEDYKENIVKPKLKTNLTDVKRSKTISRTYTPKFSSEFILKGILKNKNCTFRTNKSVAFFKEQNQGSSKSRSSSIEILNKEEIKNRETQIMEVEISKGDTSKYVIHTYADNKKINTIEMRTKNSKVKAKILIPENTRKVKVEGLGENVEIELSQIQQQNIPQEDTEEPTQETTPKTQRNETTKRGEFFKIKNIKLNQTLLDAELLIEEEVKEGECKILLSIKQVSKVTENFTTSKNITLTIDTQKLPENQTKIQLKLNCKYKKFGRKSFTYKGELFNFSKPQLQQNQSSKDTTQQTNTTNSPTQNISQSPNSPLNFRQLKIENTKQTIQEYKSKGQVQKDQALIPAIIALGSISAVLIIFW